MTKLIYQHSPWYCYCSCKSSIKILKVIDVCGRTFITVQHSSSQLSICLHAKILEIIYLQKEHLKKNMSYVVQIMKSCMPTQYIIYNIHIIPISLALISTVNQPYYQLTYPDHFIKINVYLQNSENKLPLMVPKLFQISV